ncbi:MAG: outer membrane protein transport protein [Alphaproteobacteria bacterium]|nr:outer membrane protein transport protein [Alphaproteobacteria bacterium]
MHRSLKALSVITIATLGTALSSSAANAAGFYIQEQSVSGLGAAFSGSTTSLNDPSTVYFNPAGMTRLNGIQGQLGAHLLLPNSELTDTGSTGPAALGSLPISGGDGGNPYDPTPVPNAFLTYQVNDQLWAGLALSAPFGLANEYDSDWFGRFDSIKTELTTIDIQPSVAFKINDRVSIGGGINIQYADAELTSAANPVLGGGTEGVSTLKGDDWSVGYNIGLQANPWEGGTIGLSYRSAVSHELEGRIISEGTTSADFDVSGTADLDLPDIATFGVAQDVNDKWKVMGQATWFGWNNFEDITAVTNEDISIIGGAITRSPGDVVSSVTQNYQTTWALALGTEYDYSDEWTFRGGVQFDETPTTDEFRTSRTPDGDRTWLSGGATYNINDRLSVDMAATYIWIDSETIDVSRNNSFSTAVQTEVEADTEGNVGIVAVGLTYKF